MFASDRLSVLAVAIACGLLAASACGAESQIERSDLSDQTDSDPALNIPIECAGGANPTGDPIGGGTGYSRIVSPSEATFLVNDPAGLTTALTSAVSGDTIYVEDGAAINLSGQTNLRIPGGVTLASGRGANGSAGALLFTTTYPSPQLRADGPGVRITGLRIQGAFTGIGDSNTTNSRGVYSTHDRLELDNSELWGWTYAAVTLEKNATNSSVHHNLMHHNRKTGLGYGVMFGYSDSASPIDGKVEGNLFDDNRHSVTSTGNPFSSFEARYNLVLANDTSQSLDRHGTALPGSWRGGWAGDWTLIHNNTVTRTSGLSVAIRGEPVYGARVDHNHFFSASQAAAIRLYDFNGTQVSTAPKVDIRENRYGASNPVSLVISSPADGQNLTTSVVNVTGNVSYGYGAGLCRVEMKVDSGPWVGANGSLVPGWVYSWNATASLGQGSNTITVRVVDITGQMTTASVTVEYWPGGVQEEPSIYAVLIVTTFLLTVVWRARRPGGRRLSKLR